MAYKIVICGPKASGKSTIGNFLAGHSDKLSADKYDPTVGVRVLEVAIYYLQGLLLLICAGWLAGWLIITITFNLT